MRQGGLILAAGRVHSKKKKNRKKKHGKKSAPPKTHHEIHSSPVTTSNSRRYAKKHVSRVSPYSLASIDPGFVAIGLVQLLQSIKTTNVTHTHTDRHTDKSNNGTLYAPRYEEAFLPGGKKTASALPHYEEAFVTLKFKNGFARFALSALLHYS